MNNQPTEKNGLQLRAPFGYEWANNGELATVESEKAILDSISALKETGLTTKQVIEKLCDQGHFTVCDGKLMSAKVSSKTS